MDPPPVRADPVIVPPTPLDAVARSARGGAAAVAPAGELDELDPDHSTARVGSLQERAASPREYDSDVVPRLRAVAALVSTFHQLPRMYERDSRRLQCYGGRQVSVMQDALQRMTI